MSKYKTERRTVLQAIITAGGTFGTVGIANGAGQDSENGEGKGHLHGELYVQPLVVDYAGLSEIQKRWIHRYRSTGETSARLDPPILVGQASPFRFENVIVDADDTYIEFRGGEVEHESVNTYVLTASKADGGPDNGQELPNRYRPYVDRAIERREKYDASSRELSEGYAEVAIPPYIVSEEDIDGLSTTTGGYEVIVSSSEVPGRRYEYEVIKHDSYTVDRPDAIGLDDLNPEQEAIVENLVAHNVHSEPLPKSKAFQHLVEDVLDLNPGSQRLVSVDGTLYHASYVEPRGNCVN